LGFQGVVMTDAMDMGAIVDHFTQPVAAVMAIRAGVDLITTGPHTPLLDQQAMKRAILDAVKRGDLSESRIEESVRRVLRLKARHGLLNWLPLDPSTADQRVGLPAHQEITGAIYLDTVAIVQNTGERLPLKPGAQKVALIYPGIYPSVRRECEAIDRPFQAYAYTLYPSAEEQESVRSIARDADVVLIFTYNIEDFPSQADLVNGVPPDKAVVVAMQSPYDLERGIQPSAYVTAFNAYPAAFKATCAVLYGQHPAVGRWQVSGGR
jgi:beta-N-acetylhexosaminidase